MKARNKAYDALLHQFTADEPVLIDANIWLYLYPTPSQPPPDWAITQYAAVYSNLLKSRALPITDSLVLSEYCNRYVRVEYDAARQRKDIGFKKFRKSRAGRQTLSKAVAEMHNILSRCRLIDTGLASINLDAVLQAVASGTVDFNDGILLENCRLHGFKLLTHDADMTVGGIEVLTTNGKLLKACPP